MKIGNLQEVLAALRGMASRLVVGGGGRVGDRELSCTEGAVSHGKMLAGPLSSLFNDWPLCLLKFHPSYASFSPALSLPVH